jgi:replicative DNA helicase
MATKAVSEMVTVPADLLGLHNVGAEVGVLASMMVNPDSIHEILEHCNKPELFHRPEHRMIFQQIVEKHLSGQPIDPVIITETLAEKGLLSEAGGEDYIAQISLPSVVPSLPRAIEYAKSVQKYATLRRLVSACTDVIQDMANAQELNPTKYIDRLDETLRDVIKSSKSYRAEEFGNMLEDVLMSLETKNQMGIRTEFTELDEYIMGLQPAQFIVIAGRPSMGKTSLAISIISNVAIKNKIPTLFFSFEMTRYQIGQILVCQRYEVNTREIKKGLPPDKVKHIVENARKDLQDAPLYIYDVSNTSIMDIRTVAKKLRHEHGIELIVLDYLQLIPPVKEGNSQQEQIAQVSCALKSLAKELEIPVIALAQLNRNPEGREDHRPRLADLRQSGAIEQDADIVIFLYRDDYYNNMSPRKGECQVIIAKNRTGPVGETTLTFKKEFMRFQNREPKDITL